MESFSGDKSTPTTSTRNVDINKDDNDERKVLETLASIKAQISSVLAVLQQANISATTECNFI